MFFDRKLGGLFHQVVFLRLSAGAATERDRIFWGTWEDQFDSN